VNPELSSLYELMVPRDVVVEDGRVSRIVFNPIDEFYGDGMRIVASDTYVPVGDRFVNSWLILRIEGDAGQPTFTSRVEVREGVPRIVEYRFHSQPGEAEVRASDLRQVQFDLVLAAYDESSGRLELSGVGLISGQEAMKATVDVLRKSRANRKITPDFLREVAEVYKANLATGPTRAVRERFFVSERQAGGYVQRARRLGFLPPTTPGKKRG
jgi:hypothetical protein